jgi:methionine-rich copper-binding protein CopC
VIHYLPYGTTEYQEFSIVVKDEDDLEVDEDLSGSTLGIEIHDSEGNVVTGAGTASWVTASDRHARFAPTGTLPKGKYSVRWTVTISSRTFKAPNGRLADEWIVVHP